MSLHLEIVTPKGPVVAADAEEVILPGRLGEFGVLEGHIPFLSALRPGVVQYRATGQKRHLAVGTGFAEVGAANRVLVLTDQHALPEEIDVDAARQELQEVEAELKAWSGAITPEHDQLIERAQWAQARIAAKSPPQ